MPTVPSSVQRTTVVLVGICCLVAGAGFVVGLGAASAPGEAPFEQMDIEADDVLMTVELDGSGSATWTIAYRTRLADADEESAFEELRDDIEADPESYTDRFRERMESTADAAAASTGREMSIENVTVRADRRELARTYGVVTYEFHWTGFAAVDGDRITAGDALDGLFLDDETSLIVAWSDEYRLTDTSPTPSETRDASVVWNGPVEFPGDEPRVALERVDDGDDGAGDDERATEGRDGATAPDESISAITLLGVVVAIVVVGGATYYRRRVRTAADGDDTPRDALGASTETNAGGAANDETGSVETDGDAADGEPTEDDADDADDIDTTLLSNEEQVLRLIEAQGGRMKQADVAEELDWTAAKTSQVVTGLRDEEKLDGFRLGRENVLSLPDEDEEADD